MRRNRIPTWGGSYSQRLCAAVIAAKGDVCWLCGMAGATSADHNPPRSKLIALGIANPDAMRFLFPAHVRCNVLRRARPVTDKLRAELAKARAGQVTTAATRSGRFGS